MKKSSASWVPSVKAPTRLGLRVLVLGRRLAGPVGAALGLGVPGEHHVAGAGQRRGLGPVELLGRLHRSVRDHHARLACRAAGRRPTRARRSWRRCGPSTGSGRGGCCRAPCPSRRSARRRRSRRCAGRRGCRSGLRSGSRRRRSGRSRPRDAGPSRAAAPGTRACPSGAGSARWSWRTSAAPRRRTRRARAPRPAASTPSAAATARLTGAPPSSGSACASRPCDWSAARSPADRGEP